MKNQIRTLLLLGVLSALLIGVGGLMGQGWLIGFTVLALALNAGAYFFSDRLVLRMSGAREVAPEQAPDLHRMVEELAWRAGIPKPRVFRIEAEYANAFATGRSPEKGVVAVTDGILRILSARELRAVLAHEIGHIRNRDILVASVAATLAAAIGYIANALSFSSLFGGREEGDSGAGGIAAAFVAPIVATLIQLGVSRSREYMADETGARISGDPAALASALAKLHRSAEHDPVEVEPATASLYIVNPLAGHERVAALFSTHPPVGERIRRLRVLADEPWRLAA